MKHCTTLVAVSLFLFAAGLTPADAQSPLYWDVNGDNAGGSDTDVADGTWGIDNFWSGDPNGGTTGAWNPGDIAVFSADSNVTGASAVTLDGTQSASGITFEEGTVTISGGTELTLVNSAIMDVASGAAGIISSIIGGSVGLAKGGDGTLSLSGPNTYTGDTNVNAGVLAVSNATALGDIGQGTNVSFGAALQISGSGVTYNEAINIDGEGISSDGVLRKTGSGTSTLATVVTLNGASRIHSDAGTLTMSGANSGGVGINMGSNTLTVGGVSNVTVSGMLNGDGTLIKEGTGTLTLSADNNATFFGGILINDGTLSATNSGALGAINDFAPADPTVNSGGTLQISGSGVSIARRIIINGNGAPTTGSPGGAGAIRKTSGNANTISGGIELNSAARIQSEQNTLTIASNPIIMNGNDVTFAGTASGTTGNITVSTTINGSANVIKEGLGILTLSGNNINDWSGKLRVYGGTVSWSSDNTFTNHLGVGPAVSDPANVNYLSDWAIVDGGTLRMTTNDTSGTSFMRQGRGISLGANGGTINMSSATVAAKAIYSGAIRLADDVTEATLTKTGPAEFRFNGPGTQYSGFTKLVINQGLFRAGSVAGSNFETVLGAAPATLKTDAVEFTGTAANPAYFATSFNMNTVAGGATPAWIATRGVLFSGEGTFLGSGGIEVNILGPISGSGKLIAGVASGPYNTTGVFNSGTVRLSNTDNINTFTGSVAANNGTLILNASLNATNFSGEAIGASSAADVNINGSAVVFTVGSDGTPTSYAGGLIGSGRFHKVGTGTLTLNSNGTGNPISLTSTNANAFVIDDGKIAFSTAGAGFAAAAGGTLAVKINAGEFDMSAVPGKTYTFGSLLSNTGQTAGVLRMGDNNVTLGQTAVTGRTYEGTILSTGGTFSKGGSVATPFTQTLTGNNTLAAVNVNLGRLNFNGTNTTGAVTVADTATLGGTGSVSGDVTVESGGTLAAGTSIGTFGTGALAMATTSAFQYELDSSTIAADLLNANGALSLGSATLTGLDLAGVSTELSAGAKFTLISYSGAWDTTTFAGLANGDPVTIGANTFEIKYDDTTAGSNGGLYSNFVTLVAIPPAGGLTGDYNDDGFVDAADYVLWRHNEPTDTPLLNDPTPADVEEDDYVTWVKNFGKALEGSGSGGLSGSGNGGAAPEPSTVALLLIGLAALAGRRRGH